MSSKLTTPAQIRSSLRMAGKLSGDSSKQVSWILKTLVLITIFVASINAAHFSFLDSVKELVGTASEQSSTDLVGAMAPMASIFSASPSSQNVTAGSANTFSWTFTAQNGTAAGPLLFTIPLSWPVPNTGGGNGTVAIGGTCPGILQIVAQQISVDQAGSGTSGSCGAGQTIIISYSVQQVPTPGSPPQTYTFSNNFGTSPTVTVDASAVPTTTTLASSANPSTYGQNVNFTATISPAPTGGDVDFTIDGNPVCTNVPVSGGQAVCSTSSLTVAGNPHPVHADYSGASGYFGSSGSLNGGQNVNNANQTAMITGPTSVPYDGSPHTPTVACSGGGVAFNILVGGSASQTGVGSYLVTVNCPAAPNFNAGLNIFAGNFAITVVNQTASVTAPTTVPYNGAPHTATVACSGGGAATNILLDGSATQTNAGAYAVTANCPAAGNVNAGTNLPAGNFTITAINQTATVTVPTLIPYDSFAHGATVSCSGGGVAANILTGGSPTQTNAGVYAVTADCPAIAPNYNAGVGLAAGNFTISPISQTASVIPPNPVPYNALPHSANVACSGGGVATNVMTGGAASQTNANFYSVTANCPAAQNYTAGTNLSAGSFIISPVSQTASVGAPTSISYDGSPHTASVICSGGGIATNIQLGGFATQTTAASYPVTADCPTMLPNYTATGGINAGFFTITAIDQTASVSAPASVPYDGMPHSATVMCSGGAAINVLTGGAPDQTNAGVYPVTADCPAAAPNYNATAGLSAGNYTITPISQTATVAAPLSIPYNGSPHVAAVSCSGGGVAFNIATGGAASQTNAGTYVVTADCAAVAPNYSLTTQLTASGTFTITPISQTAAVTAPFSVPYDGSLHGATVSCSGGGMAFNIMTGGSPSQANAAVYPVTADCPAAVPNYSATAGLSAGNFSITAVDQTASVMAPISNPYDGSPHSAGVSCTGGGVAFNIMTGGSATQTNAGVYAVVANCPAAAPNYNATNGVAAGSFTITAVNQTAIVAAPTSVPYDGSPHGAAVTCSGSGLAANILTGGAATQINAAVYAVTADCPAALPNYNAGSNLAAGNFTITTVNQTAVVTAPLSVPYDGLPHSATVSCSSGGAALNVMTGGAASQTNAGAYLVVADCPAAPNYNASPGLAAGSFTITQAASATVINCPPSALYTGSPVTPCTAVVTRIGDANTTTAITYGNNSNLGTATANATYGGDLNHTASPPATQATFQIVLCPAVSIPSVSTDTGQPITVPVNTTALPSPIVISADFTFTYDSTKMTPFAYPNAVTAGPVAGGGATVTYSESPGTLTVSVFNPAGFSGSGALVNLHFNTMGPGNTSAPLGLSGLLINGGSVCSSSSNGTINILSGTISGQVTYAHNPLQPIAGVLLDAPGSPHVSATTNASGNYSLSGFGPGTYTVTPSKPDVLYNDSPAVRGIFANDATLIAQHVVGLVTLNATQIQAAKVSGLPTLSSFDAALVAQWIVNTSPANPANQTGKWKFNPGNGGTFVVNSIITQNYSAILMGDVSGGWPNPAPRAEARGLSTSLSDNPVTASLTKTEAATGSRVTVPLRIANLAGRGVTSYQFDVSYDPAVVEPGQSAATIVGTISEGLTVVSNSPEPGLLKVVVFGAMPVSGDGVYVNLHFSAIGGGGTSSPLSIREFRFNDGDGESSTVDGHVFITAASDNAAIRGRLLSAYGQGIGNTRVTLTSTTGETFTTFSSSLGHFDFSGLVVGESYTVTVQAKRYRFSPRIVNVNNAVSDLDMIADQ